MVLFTAPVQALAQDLPAGFVRLSWYDPTIAQDIRYAGVHNFLGRPASGYDSAHCILTAEAAKALSQVQQRLLARNLSLKVYDCYRPERAVADFVKWANAPEEDPALAKREFYPDIEKKNLFSLKYIAKRSRHSRGSTLDLTIVPWPHPVQPVFDPNAPRHACIAPQDQRFADTSLDFGTGFDCFDDRSSTDHPDIRGAAKQNRRLLVAEMIAAGFENYHREWWHFSLRDEPFRKQYFDFPIIAPVMAANPQTVSVACLGEIATLNIRKGPGTTYPIIGTFAAKQTNIVSPRCSGASSLQFWQQQNTNETSVPWCEVVFRFAGKDTLLTGWVSGVYLAVANQPKPGCNR